MKKCILITGGCGYIGSHTIVELLKNNEFEIISIDNLSNSSIDTVQYLYELTGKKIVNYIVDLSDYQATKQVFEKNKIEGIIHFAALKSVPESVEKPLLYYHNNIESVVVLLKLCEEFKIKNFIFSSSCSIYGNNEEMPVNENTKMGLAECPYAHTKQIGETMLNWHVQKSDLQVLALRYFNPVGAHMSGKLGENPVFGTTNLVPIITQTAIGIRNQLVVHGTDYDTRDGSCVRDYIHVTDIAKAHVLALNYLLSGKNKNNYDVINLGSGSGVSVLEAISTFETSNNVKLNYILGPKRQGDVSTIYSDVKKAFDLLQWKPELTLEDMMVSAWKWQLYLDSNK